MKRYKLLSGIALAATFTFVASGLEGQICASYPATPGALSAGGNFAKVPGGSSVGVEASYNHPSPLGAFARFNLTRPDDAGENTSIIGGGISYEIGGFVPVVPSWMSVCPVAGVSVSSHDGDSVIQVPLGMGFATSIPLAGESLSVVPFALPQFILTRASVSDVTVSDHNFGIGFGGLVRLGNLYGGVTAQKEFVDASDVDVSIRGGVTIPLQ